MLDLALFQDAAAPGGFHLAWIDWVALGLAGLFLLLGLLRGLWWQVVRLVGLVASAALARTFADSWGAHVQGWLDVSNEVAVGIVWVGLFVLGIVVTALIGTLGKKSLEAIQLGLVDRAGGAVAGAATGLLLHVAFLLALAYLAPQAWVDQTLEGTHSRALLQFVTTRHNVLAKGQTESTELLHQWLGAGATGGGSSLGSGAAGSKVK
ncbi:MAG: CvpA family protein [Planctomycetes bacterium]|nr:CvpA family protein [Planctomycetota bacterium]